MKVTQRAPRLVAPSSSLLFSRAPFAAKYAPGAQGGGRSGFTQFLDASLPGLDSEDEAMKLAPGWQKVPDAKKGKQCLGGKVEICRGRRDQVERGNRKGGCLSQVLVWEGT
ncbi:hypothetical protein GQ53DRAFT_244710 [Thozetella sp. PMI_491]|nr:hypothetical protein GQ53DRAFT_244710 [Thozetella sp. PMI_491]